MFLLSCRHPSLIKTSRLATRYFCLFIPVIHTHILLTLLTFFALPILKKKIQIYQVLFLFGMSPGVDSYSCHFGTINK